MAENESTNPPADSTKAENLLATDTTTASDPTTTRSDPPAVDSAFPAVDSSLPQFDSTLPAIDTSLPPMDSTLPSFDTSLPQFDSSVPALPSIDTSMPPLDSTLPATDTHSFFGDTNQNDTQNAHSRAPGPGESSDNGFPSQLDTFDSVDRSQSNGAYQYSEQPAQEQQPSQQQSPQSHSEPPDQEQQHQYQPQQQQYQQTPQQSPPYLQQSYQQNHDMYQNSHAGTPSMNINTTPTMDYNGLQGQQQGQIPQAPIGSPMPSNGPPMPSTGQYMTGYPTQMNMNSNDQMRYQLPGDPNKMLSSGRHKKEVKRRTKTGCLTCRKRRIKVRLCRKQSHAMDVR